MTNRLRAFLFSILALGLLVGSLPAQATTSFTLTVTKSGNGGGSVASDTAGIDCGATCSADFGASTVVTLTPTPAADSVFTGWHGDCSGTGTCQVTMDSAH